jgi:hypothetical protein
MPCSWIGKLVNRDVSLTFGFAGRYVYVSVVKYFTIHNDRSLISDEVYDQSYKTRISEARTGTSVRFFIQKHSL